MSPQEILAPVLKLRPRKALAAAGARRFVWQMKLGAPKITSLYLSIQVSGQALLEVDWPRVRVEVRSGTEVCSVLASAAYGFNETTGEVALRGQGPSPNRLEPNSITLMLTGKAPSRGVVSIHLLDAVSGVELSRLENVEVLRVF